jgi:hypothetical protein
MSQHRETPIRRVNPSGAVVWVARYTNSSSRRKSAGTFKRKRDAQAAIDAAYGRAEQIESVGGYFRRWPRFHPRAERTQRTNEHRISRRSTSSSTASRYASGRTPICGAAMPWLSSMSCSQIMDVQHSVPRTSSVPCQS